MGPTMPELKNWKNQWAQRGLRGGRVRRSPLQNAAKPPASKSATHPAYPEHLTIHPADADRSEGIQHPILCHFRPSRSSANYRYGHLESNGLIGIEFDEFSQKIVKILEKWINSSFWTSLGAIWIDPVSFEAFRSISVFFIFFEIFIFSSVWRRFP